MKKLSIFNKILFFVNSILATLLLLSYLLPYISPKTIPSFAVFSLFVPVLIIINVLFFVYWLIKLKKHFLLSAVVLLIGFFASSPFFKFSDKEVILNNDFKVLSYNVRMFNHYKWNKDINTGNKIFDFINSKNADVVTLQEYYNTDFINLKYPYKYIKTTSDKNKFGLATYSKYPILKSGSLDFEKSGNNAIFTDILYKNDTIRVYNLHFESLKINKDKENFGQENSSKLFVQLENGFEKQVNQVEKFLKHEYRWKGKKIICGDFNNTAYSWVYRKVVENKKDAFVENGFGMGKTFRYIYPMRIDFILTDKNANINQFKTFSDIKLSDHYPIMARMNW